MSVHVSNPAVLIHVCHDSIIMFQISPTPSSKHPKSIVWISPTVSSKYHEQYRLNISHDRVVLRLHLSSKHPQLYLLNTPIPSSEYRLLYYLNVTNYVVSISRKMHHPNISNSISKTSQLYRLNIAYYIISMSPTPSSKAHLHTRPSDESSNAIEYACTTTSMSHHELYHLNRII